MNVEKALEWSLSAEQRTGPKTAEVRAGLSSFDDESRR